MYVQKRCIRMPDVDNNAADGMGLPWRHYCKGACERWTQCGPGPKYIYSIPNCFRCHCPRFDHLDPSRSHDGSRTTSRSNAMRVKSLEQQRPPVSPNDFCRHAQWHLIRAVQGGVLCCLRTSRPVRIYVCYLRWLLYISFWFVFLPLSQLGIALRRRYVSR
jgi:hypothetical protein